MIERTCPIAELLVIAFLGFAALIKGVAEIVVAFALQPCITREQCLTKRFQRFAVVFQFVGGRARIELKFILRARFRMRL